VSVSIQVCEYTHTHTHTQISCKDRLSHAAYLESLAAGIVAIALGVQHTCALLTGGGAVCWGDNQKGQLGTGDTTDRRTPTVVTGLETGESRIDIARRRCHGGHTSLAGSRR
jgi:alpha-tubulin suppressor-like RCC1 family protein